MLNHLTAISPNEKDLDIHFRKRFKEKQYLYENYLPKLPRHFPRAFSKQIITSPTIARPESSNRNVHKSCAFRNEKLLPIIYNYKSVQTYSNEVDFLNNEFRKKMKNWKKYQRKDYWLSMKYLNLYAEYSDSNNVDNILTAGDYGNQNEIINQYNSNKMSWNQKPKNYAEALQYLDSIPNVLLKQAAELWIISATSNHNSKTKIDKITMKLLKHKWSPNLVIHNVIFQWVWNKVMREIEIRNQYNQVLSLQNVVNLLSYEISYFKKKYRQYQNRAKSGKNGNCADFDKFLDSNGDDYEEEIYRNISRNTDDGDSEYDQDIKEWIEKVKDRKSKRSPGNECSIGGGKRKKKIINQSGGDMNKKNNKSKGNELSQVSGRSDIQRAKKGDQTNRRWGNQQNSSSNYLWYQGNSVSGRTRINTEINYSEQRSERMIDNSITNNSLFDSSKISARGSIPVNSNTKRKGGEIILEKSKENFYGTDNSKFGKQNQGKDTPGIGSKVKLNQIKDDRAGSGYSYSNNIFNNSDNCSTSGVADSKKNILTKDNNRNFNEIKSNDTKDLSGGGDRDTQQQVLGIKSNTTVPIGETTNENVKEDGVNKENRAGTKKKKQNKRSNDNDNDIDDGEEYGDDYESEEEGNNKNNWNDAINSVVHMDKKNDSNKKGYSTVGVDRNEKKESLNVNEKAVNTDIELQLNKKNGLIIGDGKWKDKEKDKERELNDESDSSYYEEDEPATGKRRRRRKKRSENVENVMSSDEEDSYYEEENDSITGGKKRRKHKAKGRMNSIGDDSSDYEVSEEETEKKKRKKKQKKKKKKKKDINNEEIESSSISDEIDEITGEKKLKSKKQSKKKNQKESNQKRKKKQSKNEEDSEDDDEYEDEEEDDEYEEESEEVEEESEDEDEEVEDHKKLKSKKKKRKKANKDKQALTDNKNTITSSKNPKHWEQRKNTNTIESQHPSDKGKNQKQLQKEVPTALTSKNDKKSKTKKPETVKPDKASRDSDQKQKSSHPSQKTEEPKNTKTQRNKTHERNKQNDIYDIPQSSREDQIQASSKLKEIKEATQSTEEVWENYEKLKLWEAQEQADRKEQKWLELEKKENKKKAKEYIEHKKKEEWAQQPPNLNSIKNTIKPNNDILQRLMLQNNKNFEGSFKYVPEEPKENNLPEIQNNDAKVSDDLTEEEKWAMRVKNRSSVRYNSIFINKLGQNNSNDSSLKSRFDDSNCETSKDKKQGETISNDTAVQRKLSNRSKIKNIIQQRKRNNNKYDQQLKYNIFKPSKSKQDKNAKSKETEWEEEVIKQSKKRQSGLLLDNFFKQLNALKELSPEQYAIEFTKLIEDQIENSDLAIIRKRENRWNEFMESLSSYRKSRRNIYKICAESWKFKPPYNFHTDTNELSS